MNSAEHDRTTARLALSRRTLAELLTMIDDLQHAIGVDWYALGRLDGCRTDDCRKEAGS